MSNLKTVLKQSKRELMKKEKIREDAYGSMRKATSLSKQAILFAHQKKTREAKKVLDEAREIIRDLHETSTKHPEIIYGGGMFSAALQEYSEANIFLNLLEQSRFVTPSEVGVSAVDYILGLADVIGEYRRLALDALRGGHVQKGEECLRVMDEIYVELMALDEAYMLVSGLRRKNDVARKIIEITRGDVTQEIRRGALENRMQRFEKLLSQKKDRTA